MLLILRILTVNTVNGLFITLTVISIFNYVWGKFPCMNEGVPVLSSKDSDFKCECAQRFYGPFCEYDSLTKKTEPFDKQVVKIALCIFFLLILPTLVIYVVRTLYLFLKRCNESRNVINERLENSPYQAVIEAAASIVLQQQCPQQLASTDDNTASSPTTFSFVRFSESNNTGTNNDTISRRTVRNSGALRRTRTEAENNIRQQRHALHTTRSHNAAPTLSMEEFAYIIRSIQSLQQLQQQQSPPPYDSVICNQTSFM